MKRKNEYNRIYGWVPERGYGFIRTEQQGRVFVHVTVLTPKVPRGTNLSGKVLENVVVVQGEQGLKVKSASIVEETFELTMDFLQQFVVGDVLEVTFKEAVDENFEALIVYFLSMHGEVFKIRGGDFTIYNLRAVAESGKWYEVSPTVVIEIINWQEDVDIKDWFLYRLRYAFTKVRKLEE
jgi:cold shock CspA family protein